MSESLQALHRSTMLRAFALRLILALAAWWALTEGDLYRWWFGLLVAVAAAASSLPLFPPSGQLAQPVAMVRFIPFFLWHSALGGIDVARRVAALRLAIEPQYLRLPLRISRGPGRLWLLATVSLMPGTLSCRLEEDHIVLHVLDRRMNVEQTIRRAEEHIAAIFGRGNDGW